MSHSKKANTFLLTENRDLQFIFTKIKRLNDLNLALAPYLDKHLKSYCQVANLIDGRLVLIASNSSIATQLRLQSNDLINQFKTEPLLQSVKTIHCKVQPILKNEPNSPSKTSKMPLLSQEAAQSVQSIADSIKDPKLSKILSRIAEHVKK